MAESPTENLHPASPGLQDKSDGAILKAMLVSQRSAVDTAYDAFDAISDGARVMAQAVATGHRLIFAGSGSAGLMALADSLELPMTFGIDARQVCALFPGGTASLHVMTGEAEDEFTNGTEDLARLAPVAGDVFICVSASGSTPYSLAVAEGAAAAGAHVIGIANVPDAPLLTRADTAVLLATGPEIVAGSTRMAAGTAQKVSLNLLSTLMGIRLGHVFDGRMINMVPDNAKLRDRAVRIVAALAEVGSDNASAALEKTGGRIKPAILVAGACMEPEEADGLLARHAGQLGAAKKESRGNREG